MTVGRSVRGLGLLAVGFSLCLTACKAREQPEKAPAQKPVPTRVPALNVKAPALPGLSPDKHLSDRLRNRLGQLKQHEPRTHHKTPDGSPRFINRLILETSPYLLQHAHNPVNWYPWADEAFAAAQTLGRPVLLSVGYATCHWCHVMESESFEDIEIATYINQNFVAIKVDREERPDVDAIYMKAVHLLRGRGGWPMTVVMTPGREPFFAGTYFPARDGDRGRQRGFFSILKALKKEFETEPDGVNARARKITDRLRHSEQAMLSGKLLKAQTLRDGFQIFKRSYDDAFGGFGRSTKFPTPSSLEFLLRFHRRSGLDPALNMVRASLERIANGGIHDHIGGGFHRYTVDRKWRIPHFEKMLYDNAQLAMLYTDAWQVTNQARFAQVAEQTLDYVAREMTSNAGGFYSATDADSLSPSGHREEGWFFTWTPAEIRRHIDEDGLRIFETVFEVDETGDLDGRNILRRDVPIEHAAGRLNIAIDTLERRLAEYKSVLYNARAQRSPPLLDDKIITAWNGLMIAAFARGGRIFGKVKYVQVARRAVDFFLKNMVDESGRLFRTSRHGERKLNAYLADYAAFIKALLEVYEATGEPHYFDRAIQFQTQLDESFAHPDGGYYRTRDDHEVLLVRERPIRDGAQPSGNALAALNLLRLYAFTADTEYLVKVDKLLTAFADAMHRRPTAHAALLSALEMRLDQTYQIVLVGRNPAELQPFKNAIRERFLPNQVLIQITNHESSKSTALKALTASKEAIDGKPTAYVCVDTRCEKPTHDPAVLQNQLSRVIALPMQSPN